MRALDVSRTPECVVAVVAVVRTIAELFTIKAHAKRFVNATALRACVCWCVCVDASVETAKSEPKQRRALHRLLHV